MPLNTGRIQHMHWQLRQTVSHSPGKGFAQVIAHHFSNEKSYAEQRKQDRDLRSTHVSVNQQE